MAAALQGAATEAARAPRAEDAAAIPQEEDAEALLLDLAVDVINKRKECHALKIEARFLFWIKALKIPQYETSP